MNNTKISFLIPSLSTGGIARVMVNLANHFAQNGHNIDLVYCKKKLDLYQSISKGVNVFKLKKSNFLYSNIFTIRNDYHNIKYWIKPIIFKNKKEKLICFLPSLIQYLKNMNPQYIISAQTYTNIITLLAKNHLNSKVKVILTEHTHLSHEILNQNDSYYWKFITPLIQRHYDKADSIVTVSKGVAKDLTESIGIKPKKIVTIYNPVIKNDIFTKIHEPVVHPWFQGRNLVILGVGRLEPQKDWLTLLKAFVLVLESHPAKLVILGEGSLRKELEQTLSDLDIKGHVEFPGKVKNPYKYMARSDVFVLSSLFEGLSNVLIEALACGCNIVSTDCLSGPAEVLKNGKYGILVPIHDKYAMSNAILTSLSTFYDQKDLINRALDFRIENSYHEYNGLIQSLS